MTSTPQSQTRPIRDSPPLRSLHLPSTSLPPGSLTSIPTMSTSTNSRPGSNSRYEHCKPASLHIHSDTSRCTLCLLYHPLTSTTHLSLPPCCSCVLSASFTVHSIAWANSYLITRDLLVDNLFSSTSMMVCYLINLIEAVEQQRPTSRPLLASHVALPVPTTATLPALTHRRQRPPSPSRRSSSYHKRPKNTFQKTENIDQALNMLRAQGSPLVGITAQSIADGQLKAYPGPAVAAHHQVRHQRGGGRGWRWP